MSEAPPVSTQSLRFDEQLAAQSRWAGKLVLLNLVLWSGGSSRLVSPLTMVWVGFLLSYFRSKTRPAPSYLRPIKQAHYSTLVCYFLLVLIATCNYGVCFLGCRSACPLECQWARNALASPLTAQRQC